MDTGESNEENEEGMQSSVGLAANSRHKDRVKHFKKWNEHTVPAGASAYLYPLDVMYKHSYEILQQVREATYVHDWVRVAGLLSMGLVTAADYFKELRKTVDHPERAVFLTDASLEVMRNLPQFSTHEAIRQALRFVQRYTLRRQEEITSPWYMSPEYGSSISSELACDHMRILLEAGNKEQAYISLVTPGLEVSPGLRFLPAKYAALLSYNTWNQAANFALSSPRIDESLPDDRHNPPVLSASFKHDMVQWKSQDRAVLDAWEKAEPDLEKAASINPSDSEMAYLQCHVYCCAGHFEKAEEVTDRISKANGDNRDGHALHALILQAYTETPERLQKIAKDCLAMLEDEIPSPWAVMTLLRLHQESAIPVQMVVSGVLLYLDSSDGDDNICSCPCWAALSEILLEASQFVELEGDRTDQETWRQIEEMLKGRASWWQNSNFSIATFRHAEQSIAQTFKQDAIFTLSEPQEDRKIQILTDKAICAAYIAQPAYFYSETAMKLLRRKATHRNFSRLQSALARRDLLQERNLVQRESGFPFATPNYLMGTISPMPILWWRSFPQYRHRQSTMPWSN